MINVNDVNKISSLLSDIFFYGLSNNYSKDSIEEKIINSDFVSSLENGDASFLNNVTNDEILDKMYKVKIEESNLIKTNPVSLWLGEVYTRLFFTINKSFNFIFLYLPLKNALNLFELFHEMDITQIEQHFLKLVNKKSVLSLLLKKRKITLYELSVLSGVKYNTLVSFTRNNEYVYKAKLDNIYKISQILKVNINIFVKQINNFTNSEIYEFDKKNFNYRLMLGCYFASYYDVEIAKVDYKLSNDILVSSIDKIDVLLYTKDIKENLYDFVNNHKAKHIKVDDINLVIFDYKNEDKFYLKLVNLGYKKIIVLTNDNCLILSKDGFKYNEITSNITDGVIWRAKSRLNGDFAV